MTTVRSRSVSTLLALCLACGVLLVAPASATAGATTGTSFALRFSGPPDIPDPNPVDPGLDTPVYAALFGVDYSSASTVWAVGAYQTGSNTGPKSSLVASSTDGGVTWDYQALRGTLDEFLSDIDVVDPTHVYAVGYQRRIYRYDGAAWVQKPVPPTVNILTQLRGVSFATTSTGFAVGDARVLLRTTDGGESWSLPTSPTVTGVGTNVVWDVDATSDGRAVAVGDGMAYRYPGSGTVWYAIPALSAHTWRAVTWLDAQRVVAVGDQGWVARSDDGGSSWVTGTVPAPAGVTQSSLKLHALAFTDGYNGVAMGDYNTVARTTDGGVTWSSDLFSDPAVGLDVAYAVAFRPGDATQMVAVGAWNMYAHNGLPGDSKALAWTATVTAPPPLAPPAAPVGAALTPIAGPGIRVSWSDVATDEAGYYVERATGGSYAAVATLTAGATSWDDIPVSYGVGYAYRIRSFRGALCSAYATAGPLTIPAPDVTPPVTTATIDAAPVNPAAWYREPVAVSLTATDPTPPLVSTYWLDGAAGAVYAGPVSVSGDGSHTLQYRSVDGSGNVEGTRTAVFRLDSTPPSTTTSPSLPDTFTGTAVVSLVASDSLSGVASTRYALDGAPGTGALVSTSATGTHTLEFSSLDVAGNREATVTRSFAVVDPPPGVPAAPTLLSAAATLAPSARVGLAWQDNSGNETSFRIERSTTGAGGTFSEVASTAAGVTSWTDTSVSSGSSYSYRMRAFNGATPSAYSNTLSVTVPVPPVVRAAIRVGGADRYVVAADLARRAFPGWAGVSTVIVACGSDAKAADPLGAAGLSGAANAPVLLVRTDSKTQVPGPTTQALAEIAAANGGRKPEIVVVGGPLSVTAAQWTILSRYASSMRRLSGADRYAVAANVAYEIRRRSGGANPPFVLIAAGNTPARFFDPLALGPIAARMKAPVLLTKGSVVPPATLAAVRSLAPDTADRYLGSDVSAVNEAARSALGATRITGVSSDRSVLAVAVARYALGKGWLSAECIGVTNALADSLGGGAAMGALGGPVLYTGLWSLPASTSSLLDDPEVKPVLTTVYVIGGPASVSEPVFTAIGNLLK